MKIPFVRQGLNRAAEALPGFELQNLYPALEGQDIQGLARQGPALVQVPGALEWTDTGSSVIRGLFRFPGAAGGLFYVVAGTSLLSIAADKTVATIGTITGADPVQFAMIRDTLLICADGKVWHTTGGAPTQVTDPDLGTIGAIAAMDGRLIAAREASDTFVWSDVFAPGTIAALSFATAEGYGDRLVRPVVYQRQLYLIGERTTEIWGPTGSSTAPFARVGGAVEPFGCPAKYSVAQLGPALFFVAVNADDDTPFVVKLEPEGSRVSDQGIEALLRGLSAANLAAVRGMVFRIAGASFYQLDLPGAGTYWLHIESGVWLRRRKGSDSNWLGGCCADAHGKILVGSSIADGKIFELSALTYTDAGATLSRVATCYLPVERPTPISTLVIDAATAGAAGTPTASVALSVDDGATFRAARTVSLDKPGARAPLSFGWGSVRRPGALAKVTIDGAFRATVFNLLVNEAAS
jgi:hypothetical protein